MKTVLCFGDSNTHGTVAMAGPGDRGRFAPAARWPAIAAAGLGDGWALIPEGQPGRTSVHADPVEGGQKSGAAVLPALLESHRPLDAVAIMLGTNELKHRFALTPADIAAGLERLLDLVAGSDVGPEGRAPAVLLIAPTPIREAGTLAETFTGGAAKSRALADRIGAMAARRGAAFLDAGTVAGVDPVDGIHLTEAAQAALGRAAAAALTDLLD